MVGSIRKKVRLGLLVLVTAAASGVATSWIMAAIPHSSSGQISACYRNQAGLIPKGSLRVLDEQGGQACGANETAVSWNQGAPVLRDANGQVLGSVIDYASNIAGDEANPVSPPMQVYNLGLKRVMPLRYNDFVVNNPHFEFGQTIVARYQSADCTGQAYLISYPGTGIKTTLFRIPTVPAETHVLVTDIAQASSITAQSIFVDAPGSADYNGPECRAISAQTVAAFPLTTVVLPFNAALATPLKF